jgi:putative urate catabolism protein
MPPVFRESDGPGPRRDVVGYGRHVPQVTWPEGARVAVSLVLNWEEGSEYSKIAGDGRNEGLAEIPYVMEPEYRDLAAESVYEYGARAGFWRLLRLFTERRLTLTVYAVGMALERNPAAGRAMVEAGFEVASHGWRWIDYHDVPEHEERADVQRAIEAIERVTGQRPVGWYTGRISPRTRTLVVEAGGFLYDSDSYADDLPYWVEVEGKPHLVVPYTLDNNDMKFAIQNGFDHGESFFQYLRDAFDVLYAEGLQRPKMMSIGLHCRLAGRPGRAAALIRFIDYARSHDGVWITTRAEIARHWHRHHPPPPRP